ncbi:small ribosomal subunit protein bS18m isoform X2 [Culicoides brevitarsis]|uniref:small ribosomal subunit protein bS18m isoform X2 n=1 Tax=Culicoides brevitarsis TaxID=469753 RepID=UPI00307B4E20
MNALKLLQNGLRARNPMLIPRPAISRLYSTEKTPTTSEKDPDMPISMENPFEKEKKICILCKFNIEPDYKNVRLLSQFQSPYTGRIYGRHITGLCKKRQEQVENAIQKSLNAGLMPSYHKQVQFVKDPQLFNAQRPLKPHKY